MNHFTYKNKALHCEDVAISTIAEQVGTPFYLYSKATLTRHFKAFDSAFTSEHITCFATKSCSNIGIMNLFANLGGGADIVSGGELFRALKAGMDPQKIVYSGVGKSREELRYGLESGILMFNVESQQELLALQDEAAALDIVAPVSFRVNPDVDPKTHAYISTGLAKNKFGIPIETALDVYKEADSLSHINIVGVSCHIGSQLTDVSPFVESLQKVKTFVASLRDAGLTIKYIDLGGGLGITYDAETPPEPSVYAKALEDELGDSGCTLILEPGRVIVGNAGILVTKVLYTKQGGKKFTIVDAGMNDLARPSLYGAYHKIQPVVDYDQGTELGDVVGPICETGDFLAKEQEVPVSKSDDLLAVMSAGAYGFTMSSNYNTRPRVVEVLVDGDQIHVIRKRETLEMVIAGEVIPGE
jgi:diaminopimelate decarboxylase